MTPIHVRTELVVKWMARTSGVTACRDLPDPAVSSWLQVIQACYWPMVKLHELYPAYRSYIYIAYSRTYLSLKLPCVDLVHFTMGDPAQA